MVLTPSAAGGRAECLEPADGAGECGTVHRPAVAGQHAVRLDVPLKVEVGVEFCGSSVNVVNVWL